ncbi:voltage-gated potassium channel regulatory subunit KCNF1-like [Stigmatopora argus]
MWTIPKPRYGSRGQGEITVNIGGVRVALCGDVLKRYPESRLAQLAKLAKCSSAQNEPLLASLCDDFDLGRGEFYFDRDPDAFRCIVDGYYAGQIHIRGGICPVCFVEELHFWKMEQGALDECCKSYLSEKEGELREIAGKVKAILEDAELERGATSGAGSYQRFQSFLWRLIEKPDSSLGARLVAVASFLFVLLSAAVMCAGTLPELQVSVGEDGGPGEARPRAEHPALEAMETACMSWFTAEYLLRLASSPDKWRFALSFLNLVDLVAIAPFYLVLALTYLGTASVLELARAQQAVQAHRGLGHCGWRQLFAQAIQQRPTELTDKLEATGVGWAATST